MGYFIRIYRKYVCLVLQLELLFPLAVQMRAFDFFALIRYLQPPLAALPPSQEDPEESETVKESFAPARRRSTSVLHCSVPFLPLSALCTDVKTGRKEERRERELLHKTGRERVAVNPGLVCGGCSFLCVAMLLQ